MITALPADGPAVSLRVTWLLPVRNGMPFLTEALASVEAQTYTNWEIIAWVNGSDDGTLEELQRWIPSRLPGRIVADAPTSYAQAMAEMTLRARTELCAIVHADDVSAPDRLAKQVAFMECHPEVAALGSGYDLVDAAGAAIAGVNHPYEAHDDIVHYMIQNTALGCPTVLFRRSAVLAAGNHRRRTLVEDYDLWLRLALEHKLANLPDCLLHYRIHPQSTTQVALTQNRVASAANACFYESAPALYGLSQEDAARLRERRHPFALRPLLGIAKHLSRAQGGTLWGRFLSPSFVEGGRGLVHPHDIVSRLLLTLLAYRHVPLRDILSRLRQKLRPPPPQF